MKDHREFTFGWWIFAFVIPIHLFLTYLYIDELGDKPIDTNGYVVITLIFVVICLLFCGLTTKVTSDAIVVLFGIGLIRKNIKLESVKAVDVVNSSWFYGWGIRIIRNGVLYNISGTCGVEVRFHDTRRVVRIGSKNASTLKQEIERRLV